ncbi:MAG: helix-turn-helix domain-containing protein [Desulfurivibrionaceae bacterium]
MDTESSENNRNSGFEGEGKQPSQDSLGTYLRKERLKRGFNLQEIAEGTCIHIATLRALEDDDESRITAEVFTRGFLRLYAEYIGLDPQEVLKHYNQTKKESYPSGTWDYDLPSKKKIARLHAIFSRKYAVVLLLFLLIGLGLIFYLYSPPD